MSSRLQIIANHSIPFEQRSLSEIGAAVCKQLTEQLQLPNESFIKADLTERGEDTASENEWTFAISKSLLYGGLDESDYLYIKSTWKIDLIVEEGYLLLLPLIHKTKHYNWFNYDPNISGFEAQEAYFAYQDEWSRTMIAIVEALGGHTIYILADMEYDHNYKSSDTFDEIERTLYEKCGPAKTNYEDMNYDPDEDELTPYFKITKSTIATRRTKASS